MIINTAKITTVREDFVTMKELLDIFIAFAGVGVLTFGGGYAMLQILQKNISARRQWVTEEEITDFYAVSQCLPGIIAVNTSMFIGHKHRGIPGMAAAALGVIFPSVLVILTIAMFILRFLEYEWVRYAFNSIQAAVLALITDAVIKMWKSGVKDIFGICIFAGALALFALLPISPILPLLAGAVCGIVIKERKRVNP
jgi:chromate transporter